MSCGRQSIARRDQGTGAAPSRGLAGAPTGPGDGVVWASGRVLWSADMRVACFTPLPPARTGVADYSAALVPYLARLCTVEVFTDGAPDGDGLGAVPTLSHEAHAGRGGDFDCTVYQFGNNARCHAFMYPYVLRHPGVIVLHDLSLLHFYLRLYGGPARARALLAEVEHSEGSPGRATLLEMLRPGSKVEPLRLPLLRRVVEASVAVVTHSRWGREGIAARWPGKVVHHIPMGASSIERRAGGSPRELLGWGDAAVVVGSVGLVDQPERTGLLLRAFGRAMDRQPALRLLLFGVDGERLAPRCGSLVERLPPGAVAALGHIPATKVDAYVAACDIIVRLRHPTAGESSSVIARAFGAGCPVIATDAPQLHEIGGGFCIRVSPGAGEEAAVADALSRLAAHPEERRRLGETARRSVQGHGWAQVADCYLEVFERARGTA